MSLTITPITEQDFDDLYSMISHFAKYLGEQDAMTNTPNRMHDEAEIIQGRIVRDDGKPIAYITWFYSYYSWIGKSLYIDDIYIEEAYRHSGLGLRLMDMAFGFAKKNDCHCIKWLVKKKNTKAIGFYKSIGVSFDDAIIICSKDL